jgi:hypothetical protein
MFHITPSHLNSTTKEAKVILVLEKNSLKKIFSLHNVDLSEIYVRPSVVGCLIFWSAIPLIAVYRNNSGIADWIKQ